MNSKVALLCVLLIFVLSIKVSKKRKRQKGGSVRVVAVAVVLVIGTAAGAFAIYSAVSSGSEPDTQEPDTQDPVTPAPVTQDPVAPEPVTQDDASPAPYIKYDSSSRSWGDGKPCTPFSDWDGNEGTNAETDTSVTADDGMVICQVPSAGENGECTDDCVDECSNYYGRSSDSDDKLHICGARGRDDNKCVTTRNDLFRVYTDSECSGP